MVKMQPKGELYWRYRNIAEICSRGWYSARHECYCCYDPKIVCDHLESINGQTPSVRHNQYVQTPDYNRTLFFNELRFIPENFAPLCHLTKRDCHGFVSYLTNYTRPLETCGKVKGVKDIIQSKLNKILENPNFEEHEKSWELEILQRQLEVSYWHFDRIRNPLNKVIKDKRGNILFIANNKPNKSGNDFIDEVKKLLEEVAQMTEIDVHPPIYDNRINPYLN